MVPIFKQKMFKRKEATVNRQGEQQSNNQLVQRGTRNSHGITNGYSLI